MSEYYKKIVKITCNGKNYFDTSKLRLPSVILFQRPLPKRENNGGRCDQLCRSLDQAQCCLSAAKGDENKELRFEEIRKDPCLGHYENHGRKSFCASLHLK